jgi:exosortase/archaeosortase family protein
LLLPDFTIDISDACSGFSALYASAFVAVVMAAHSQSRWHAALLVLSVWPIAVLANMLRAAALVGLMDIYGREILDTQVHPASGAATFVMALAALYVLAGKRTIQSVIS